MEEEVVRAEVREQNHRERKGCWTCFRTVPPKRKGTRAPKTLPFHGCKLLTLLQTWDPISAGKQTFRLGGRLNQAVRSGQSDQSLTGCG